MTVRTSHMSNEGLQLLRKRLIDDPRSYVRPNNRYPGHEGELRKDVARDVAAIDDRLRKRGQTGY